jgi:glycosyltransferase involved in cell wall biosynthesis
MRVIIVAEHASGQFGGEAFLPLNYFRLLRARNIDVHLVVHSRTAEELRKLFPQDLDRLHFINDNHFQQVLYRLGEMFPRRLAEATTGFVSHLRTQVVQRRLVRELVRVHGIDVVHEPIPVSPKSPSLMWDVGAPVVMGPLNGGMEYPKAFSHHGGPATRLAVGVGRYVADILNYWLPGKRQARIILVANQRTREALPRGLTGTIAELVENGVDLTVWKRTPQSNDKHHEIRFVFVGRLVDWKAVDIILEAIRKLSSQFPVSLEIIGDGNMRQRWENLAEQLGVSSIVHFLGFMSQAQCAARLQQADVFLLPSIFECGGAVVLEAMAMGLPVIATAWGGPVDYLDEKCGILVEPVSREALVDGFVAAMELLVRSPELRHRMGQAGVKRAVGCFDWELKTDRILKIYELAIGSNSSAGSEGMMAKHGGE